LTELTEGNEDARDPKNYAIVRAAAFDARPLLTNAFYKASYHAALTFGFVFLVFVYGRAAL
jgi:hypothetical protein